MFNNEWIVYYFKTHNNISIHGPNGTMETSLAIVCVCGQTTTQPAQPLAMAMSIIDMSQLYIEAVTITELQELGTFFISLVMNAIDSWFL